MSDLKSKICGEELSFLSQKAIFWEKYEMLILSDLHLGKAGHFRKHGIPVSKRVHNTDLTILKDLLVKYKPKEVLLLGDLFHSGENNEWEDFKNFIQIYDEIRFVLVRGNHDILEEYPSSLEVIDILERPPFSFTHEKEDSTLFNLSGHIHPGYRINGLAREGLTIPCFWFSSDFGVLPAFGQFTGIKKIRPKNSDRVFGIADDNVIELI